MPARPGDVADGDGGFEHQLGYYATLYSFITYSFGWTRPDLGLAWWWANRNQIDDRRFALIEATWGRDGTLLGFLGWLSRQPPESLARNTLSPWARSIRQAPLEPEPSLSRALRASQTDSIWHGGTDPLHLGGGSHISGPSAPPVDASAYRLVGLDPETRSATYICDTIAGWYFGLNDLGRQLPELAGGRSWRVDVFVRPIGFLGTYRRSRSTALWFCGTHEVHQSGN